ncbi:RE1 [Symbiodinium sp. CCMP2592]|nr:RE1 [Symbiodinium sp. CCMP2592]
MSATGAITKNKDGVPQWTGDSATFNEYEEQCLLYEQSTEYYKRYMVAPRLISELQGPAKRLVVGRRPDWVSYDGGVTVLLSTLRASLGKPQVSELADFLTRYFKQTRRRSQESMPDYITRKCETYLRAQQALQRVLPHQGTSTRSSWSAAEGEQPWSRRVSVESMNSTGAGQPATPVDGEAAAQEATEEGDETTTQATDDQWRWGGWHSGWTWSNWNTGYQGWNWQRENYDYKTEGKRKGALVEILPDFVQGWYLLFDSGLSANERNMIHTASYMGEDLEEDDEEAAFQESYVMDNLNEEGQALMIEAEEDVQHAMAVIQQARRTLKEARARQQQVKLSRQYFKNGPPRHSGPSASSGSRPGGFGSGRGGLPRDDSQMVCLKCNKVGHRAANCPLKENNTGQAQMADEPEDLEHAPFICYTEQALAVEENSAYMTTQQAVKDGWCVLDGGATRTLGSINAVQNVLDKNLATEGNTRLLSVDPKRKPTFSFGNSSENRCASTIELGIQAAEKQGRLTIHTLDEGNGPVLLSVASLRSLGAIIDFSEDLVCFRAIDPCRLVRARRSQSGHQLLPLSGNMCEEALQQKLRDHGEDPPERWTKVELRQRLVELEPELATNSRRGDKDTELRTMIHRINQARQKKATLIQLCEGDLQLILTGNETVAQLERRAVEQAHKLTPADGRDYVGFGKHAALQYLEINRYQASYRAWVIQTDAESAGADYRLRRLAKWLRENPPDVDPENETPHRETQGRSKAAPKRKTGPASKALSLPMNTLEDEKAATSSTSTSAEMNQMAQAIMQMAGAIQNLQQDMNEMKEERPRKKDGKDRERQATSEGTSDGYTKVEKPRCSYHVRAIGRINMGSVKEKNAKGVQFFRTASERDSHVSATICHRTSQSTVAVQEEQVPDFEHEPRDEEGYHTEEVQKAEELAHLTRRGKLGEDKANYFSFGAFSYGAQYGVTRRKWTSLVINYNHRMPMHKDVNNETSQPNLVIGVRLSHLTQADLQQLREARNFRSIAISDYCHRHEIYLDLVPGEAHWKIGVCEQAVQGLKTVMSKVCDSEDTISAEEALATAVRTFNQRDLIRGFSPVQHVLGQVPDETGRIDVATPAIPPELLIENPTGEFQQAVRRRSEAEKAHAEWNAQQRLKRAANSRSRPVMDYHPGELVFYWRQQDSAKNRQGPSTKRGYFMGPARILAMETKRNPDGTLKPGSTVWCVRGRQLIKCCVEQLRRASQREELVETLTDQDTTPWSFSRVSEQIGGNQYEDVSGESPTDMEWWRSQEPEEEQQPTRYRFRGKRPAHQPVDEDSDEELISDGERIASSSSRQRPRRHEEAGICWWSQIQEEQWGHSKQAFWQNPKAGVEVEIELPNNPKSWSRALQDLPCYMVGAMKRRAIEVREKTLSEDERAQFSAAKAAEVKNFLASQAFESLPSHLKPSREQAIGMRWILTWKYREDGSRKAKARAVLLGYQDPSYEHRSTTAPVMSRQSRQMLLQQAANRQWTVHKGDVSGAFLQGREYPDVLHCIPCDEICDGMNIPRGSITRLKRACYGLVDAPLEWYRSVSEFLEGLGLQRTWSDACTWTWRVRGQLRGIISGHVDDFLFAGSDHDQEWQEILRKIKERFKWGDWERDEFIQCGVKVEKVPGGYALSQAQYVEGLSEIPLNAQRKRQRKENTSEREKSQLRAALGSLSWVAQQTAPHLSAEVSLLLSEVSTSTVETIVKTNQLTANVKQRKHHKMLIHGFAEGEDLAMYAWVDAANANRPDGGSTQGIFVGLGPKSMLKGAVGSVSPMAWHSSKVDRVCRSPGAAEALAAVNGEDALFYARYQWSELQNGERDVRDSCAVVQETIGCLVTDSRNVYDKLSTEVIVVKGAERRTDLELLGLKESQTSTNLQIRWVHSEAQLSNSLTKAGGGREIELYYQMQHRWRIVEDEQMRSARRRKQDGLAPLGDDVVEEK